MGRFPHADPADAEKNRMRINKKAALAFMKYVADHGEIWAKAGHIPAKAKIVDDPEFKKSFLTAAIMFQ